MTPYNFVSENAYLSMIEAVKTQAEFGHNITVSKVRIEFCSSIAGCDFPCGEVMEGDYIIHEYFSKRYGDWHGFGRALSVTEFLFAAESYTEFIRYIDKSIKKLEGVEKYKPLEAVAESGGIKVSQLSLFI